MRRRNPTDFQDTLHNVTFMLTQNMGGLANRSERDEWRVARFLGRNGLRELQDLVFEKTPKRDWRDLEDAMHAAESHFETVFGEQQKCLCSVYLAPVSGRGFTVYLVAVRGLLEPTISQIVNEAIDSSELP
jgi:hypothetical protein